MYKKIWLQIYTNLCDTYIQAYPKKYGYAFQWNSNFIVSNPSFYAEPTL